MGDDRRVIKIADQLAIRAQAADGAALDADVIRAGLAQLGEILGDGLAMSGADEAAVSFGLDVDADLGALVITRDGKGVIDAFLAWSGGDVVFLLDEEGEEDDEDVDPGDVEFEFDEDDEYDFEDE